MHVDDEAHGGSTGAVNATTAVVAAARISSRCAIGDSLRLIPPVYIPGTRVYTVYTVIYRYLSWLWTGVKFEHYTYQ